MNALDFATAGSSVAFRALAYIFLRWIPGHPLPPILASLFLVWLAGFAIKVKTTSAWEILVDQIEVITKPIQNEAAVREELDLTQDEPVEELDVSEHAILVEKDRHVLRTLLTGLPSPSSTLTNAITFLINFALIAMVCDLTYTAALFYPSDDLSFARLGYVSDTTAKLLLREPDALQLPVFLSYRYADAPVVGGSVYEGAWKSAGTITQLSEDTDFTTILTIKRLQPDTRYQYAFSNNRTGYFITSPRPGHFSQRKPLAPSFSFMHTSCIIPHFPYNPLHSPLEIPGLRYLSPWLAALKPAFMLFLGDFIYIDVPARHGVDVATYRRAYRQVYSSPAWPGAVSTSAEPIGLSDYEDFNVPWVHVYDDHDIANDWTHNTTGVYRAAYEPYGHYHVSPNPPIYRHWATYFTFTHGPAQFFLLDTRRFRTQPAANDSAPASMLGEQQLADLLTWINSPAPYGVRWRFIISSVPFTKNWPINRADTWGGFLVERRKILEATWERMATSSLSFVVLSGDRHEFAATAFPPPMDQEARWPRERCTVYEFSASPLDMFYSPIGSYRQTDTEDVRIAYLPKGNFKFGAIEITGETGSGQSVLKYKLYVEGREKWSHMLLGQAEGEREKWT